MKAKPTNAVGFTHDAPSLLCIGLDIAWFGGSAGNRDSQYDCIAAAHLTAGTAQTPQMRCEFSRIALVDRDPQAVLLLQALTDLLRRYDTTTRIILALDAPVQTAPRPHLLPRIALPTKGTVVRRASENHFSRHRQRIDKIAGGSAGWQPNIQPGAPLAPRVISLLQGLQQQGISLWTLGNQHDNRLLLECFPAEAIWAMKRLGQYHAKLSAEEVKSYKKQQGKALTANDVRSLVHAALDAFAASTGQPMLWESLLESALTWMLADETWQTKPGLYRGGKLLDDVVDTMICLATAMSYALGHAHVWRDPAHADDGHIIGPGLLLDSGTVLAKGANDDRS